MEIPSKTPGIYFDSEEPGKPSIVQESPLSDTYREHEAAINISLEDTPITKITCVPTNVDKILVENEIEDIEVTKQCK